MAVDHNPPFVMSLDTDLLERLSELVEAGKARSISAIIRDALEVFDFDEFQPIKPNQKAVSVRLPVEVREMMNAAADAKNASVGHLVRTAIENFIVNLDSEHPGQMQIALAESPAPAAVPVAEPEPMSSAPKRGRAKAAPKSSKAPAKTKAKSLARKPASAKRRAT